MRPRSDFGHDTAKSLVQRRLPQDLRRQDLGARIAQAHHCRRRIVAA